MSQAPGGRLGSGAACAWWPVLLAGTAQAGASRGANGRASAPLAVIKQRTRSGEARRYTE